MTLTTAAGYAAGMQPDPTALAVTTSTRTGRALAAVARALGLTAPVEKPTTFDAGGDFAAAAPVESRYSPTVALSGYLHPVVFAATNAITEDLASLPIVVRDPKGEPIPGHWLHRLLGNTGHSPRLWRQLVMRDVLLVGRTVSVLQWSNIGRREPIGVRWAHPARVRPVPGPDGTAIGFEIGMDRVQQYPPEAVLAVLTMSYEDGPDILSGVGATRVLHSDLVADEALAKSSAKSAASGRPAAIYRPDPTGAGGAGGWAKPVVDRIQHEIKRLFAAEAGGVAVLGDPGGDLRILGWSPKDMEGPQQRSWVRSIVTMALGVPPVRLGIDGANTWATSDAQMTAYWQQLIGRVAPFDDALTALVRRIDGEGFTVAHDFSGVPALQVAQDRILARVAQHIANGMSARAAYVYEGWDDVPEDAFTTPPAAQAPPAPAAAPASAPVMVEEEDDPEDPEGMPDVSDALEDAEGMAADLDDALAVLSDPDATDEAKAEALAQIASVRDDLAAATSTGEE